MRVCECVYTMRIYYGSGSTSHRCSGFVGFLSSGVAFPTAAAAAAPVEGRTRRKARCAPPGPVARCVSRVSQAFYPCTLHIIVNNKRDYAGGNS